MDPDSAVNACCSPGYLGMLQALAGKDKQQVGVAYARGCALGHEPSCVEAKK